jgi:hypothetical protein
MRRADLAKACFVFIVPALTLALQPHQAKGQNPWGHLSGFQAVTVSRIADTAAVAVLVNPENKLLAMVVFPAACDGEGCVLRDPGAFFVTDLEGGLVRLHIEPGHEDTSHPILASVLEGFSVA